MRKCNAGTCDHLEKSTPAAGTASQAFSNTTLQEVRDHTTRVHSTHSTESDGLATPLGVMKRQPSPPPHPRLAGKTALVVAGRPGPLIGELTTSLLQHGASVTLAFRHAHDARIFINNIRKRLPKEATARLNSSGTPVNLASLDSVKQFTSSVNSIEQSVDLLLLHAGDGYNGKRRWYTKEGIAGQAQVGFLGPASLLHLLQPKLASSHTTIILTSSPMHRLGKVDSIDELLYTWGAGNPAATEVALLVYTHQLAQMLKYDGVNAAAVDVGLLREQPLAGSYLRKLPPLHQILQLLLPSAHDAAHLLTSVAEYLETGSTMDAKRTTLQQQHQVQQQQAAEARGEGPGLLPPYAEQVETAHAGPDSGANAYEHELPAGRKAAAAAAEQQQVGRAAAEQQQNEGTKSGEAEGRTFLQADQVRANAGFVTDTPAARAGEVAGELAQTAEESAKGVLGRQQQQPGTGQQGGEGAEGGGTPPPNVLPEAPAGAGFVTDTPAARAGEVAEDLAHIATKGVEGLTNQQQEQHQGSKWQGGMLAEAPAGEVGGTEQQQQREVPEAAAEGGSSSRDSFKEGMAPEEQQRPQAQEDESKQVQHRQPQHVQPSTAKNFRYFSRGLLATPLLTYVDHSGRSNWLTRTLSHLTYPFYQLTSATIINSAILLDWPVRAWLLAPAGLLSVWTKKVLGMRAATVMSQLQRGVPGVVGVPKNGVPEWVEVTPSALVTDEQLGQALWQVVDAHVASD
eukprot:GHRR01034508.1.p1 GENE.GHRR01034508.1~~GHRR01034508.1.p1  ORF type:complete len:739 (+),score=291.15 GHRR01034508.1:24-2240(+)